MVTRSVYLIEPEKEAGRRDAHDLLGGLRTLWLAMADHFTIACASFSVWTGFMLNTALGSSKAVPARDLPYPQIKFSSIGWKCFAGALRTAWAEAREAARIAAIPAPEKATRIAVLNRTIELASYRESWPQASHEINAARAESTFFPTSNNNGGHHA